jgi:GH25 family lysozyme M1 (1,4-beta-N-acetylmuramidase)
MQRKNSETDIEGLDISSYQTITNADLLYSKSDYIIFRAYGSDHTGAGDPTFEPRVAEAKEKGVLVGSYYFGIPRFFPTDAEIISHAQGEAQQYIDKLYGAFGVGNVGDLVPFLDVEEYKDIGTQITGYPKASGMTGAQLITWVKAFRDYFWTITKRRVGFYSNRYFLTDPSQMGITTQQLTEISNMPLWLAEYDQWYGGSEGNVQPANLGGWDMYVLWQYAVIADSPTWGISSAGNEVDHNRASDLSWIKPPPPINNFSVFDEGAGVITVKIKHPNVIDYIGSSVYVNNIWRAWIPKTTEEITISNLSLGEIEIQIATEDNYHDITFSGKKTLLLTQNGGNSIMARSASGVSSQSVERFVIDAGAVYVNLGEVDERLLGATRGGNSFEVEQDIKLIEIDGVRGASKGARRVIESNARIVCNLLELSTQNIMLAIAGATATDYTDPPAVTPSHDQIRRTRNITDIDYVKNVAIVGKISGSDENIICMIYNALSDGGFSLGMEDREEGVLEVTFTAHYDLDNVDEEPWSIMFPKEV